MAKVKRLSWLRTSIYTKIFSDYPKELGAAVGTCSSLLNVGCGDASPIASFSHKLYSMGIDAHEPSIEKSRLSRIHNDYVTMDVLDIVKNFEPHSFDCVLASDVIEHLSKEDGNRLIDMMEKIARHKVIIFTPNGFLPQGEYDDNPWQVHKSGWTIDEMEQRGYTVIGIGGWKPLRGEGAAFKFWPKYFWWVISDISQLFLRNKPRRAFQLLCVKTKSATDPFQNCK